MSILKRRTVAGTGAAIVAAGAMAFGGSGIAGAEEAIQAQPYSIGTGLPSAAVTHDTGTLVETADGQTYVFAGGEAFPLDAEELAAIRSTDTDQVVTGTVTDAEISASMRDGTVVQVTGRSGYWVAWEAKLYAIPTLSQLEKLGYDPAMVGMVPDSGDLDFVYGTAAPDAAITHPDGALVQVPSGGIYFFAGGEAYPLPDPEAFAAVRAVDPAGIVLGTVTTVYDPAQTRIGDGALLRSSLSPAMFVVHRDELYGFVSVQEMVSLGYSPKRVLVVPFSLTEQG